MLVTLTHKSSKSHGPLAIHQHPSLYSGVSVLCMCMHQAGFLFGATVINQPITSDVVTQLPAEQGPRGTNTFLCVNSFANSFQVTSDLLMHFVVWTLKHGACTLLSRFVAS